MKPTKSTPVKDRLSHSTTSSANYKVIPTDIFISEAKKLAEKYPNIREDFRELQKQLKKDAITGNYSLGQDCYKVRMAISDKNQGESGGGRVIIEVACHDTACRGAVVCLYIGHRVEQYFRQGFADDGCGALCDGFIDILMAIGVYSFHGNEGVAGSDGPGINGGSVHGDVGIPVYGPDAYIV